jgi:hypothetical protein
VTWESRGCNEVTGRFIVGQLQFDANGALQKLYATFEHHCEGKSAALRGSIWIDMQGSTSPPPPPVLPPATGMTTLFSYTSDPGDPIGQGKSGSYATADTVFIPRGTQSGVSIVISPLAGSDFFSLSFKPATGQVLQPGTYDPVTTDPSSSGPALSTVGFGFCAGMTGKFTILEYTYGTQGNLYSFRATFELRCGAATAALHGDIRVMANPWR